MYCPHSPEVEIKGPKALGDTSFKQPVAKPRLEPWAIKQSASDSPTSKPVPFQLLEKSMTHSLEWLVFIYQSPLLGYLYTESLRPVGSQLLELR